MCICIRWASFLEKCICNVLMKRERDHLLICVMLKTVKSFYKPVVMKKIYPLCSNLNEFSASPQIFPVEPHGLQLRLPQPPLMLRINPLTGASKPAVLIMLSLIQFTCTVLQAEHDPGVLHIHRYLIYTV